MSNNNFFISSILIGDSAVGKSSLIKKYVHSDFSDFEYSTIGVDFSLFSFFVNNIGIKLQLWDTAGQERFHTITSSFLNNKNICIFCFDVSDPSSFYNLSYWIDKVDSSRNNFRYKCILGLKIDKPRSISFDEAKSFADSLSLDYFELSSKSHSSDHIHFNFFFNIVSNLINSFPLDLSSIHSIHSDYRKNYFDIYDKQTTNSFSNLDIIDVVSSPVDSRCNYLSFLNCFK